MRCAASSATRPIKSSSPTPRVSPVMPWPPASKKCWRSKRWKRACVPPVANFKEVDPELGELNLSKGGDYPVEYALRLGAGFGSQISMTLLRWVATKTAFAAVPMLWDTPIASSTRLPGRHG